MAVTYADSKEIKWTTYPSGLDSISTVSILAWFSYSSLNVTDSAIMTRFGSDATYFWRMVLSSSGTLRFNKREGASNTTGAWDTSSTLSSSTLYFSAATFDFGSVSNTPVIYLNGSSVSISATVTPVATGTRPADGNITSSVVTANRGIIGTIYNTLVYNRILSASEIADAYASKLAIPSYRGLIFAPQLWGCAGGVAEGGTMAAGNTVADAVSGALGVPSGSPVFKGDTVLTFQS